MRSLPMFLAPHLAGATQRQPGRAAPGRKLSPAVVVNAGRATVVELVGDDRTAFRVDESAASARPRHGRPAHAHRVIHAITSGPTYDDWATNDSRSRRSRTTHGRVVVLYVH